MKATLINFSVLLFDFIFCFCNKHNFSKMQIEFFASQEVDTLKSFHIVIVVK